MVGHRLSGYPFLDLNFAFDYVFLFLDMSGSPLWREHQKKAHSSIEKLAGSKTRPMIE